MTAQPDDVISPASTLLAPHRAAVEKPTAYLLARPHGVYSDAAVTAIVTGYYDTATPIGLDALLAISQMVLETAHLTSYWSQPPRRNPAGIGVTGAPGEGLSFPDWTAAVRAHLGRLLAYALPIGAENPTQRTLIEEALRWRPLPDRLRGRAPTLAGLTGTWAADPRYADSISRVANQIRLT